MENWYFILFDLVFLALIALLFYRFQKKRIIKNDKLELIAQINNLIEKLPFEYHDVLRISLESRDWQKLSEDLLNLPQDLQTPKDEFQKMIDDLRFFTRN
tara:strand:+ start:20370 stop:20669 length:300 start_codon:yes stop_codon:yes gene_type:complete